MVKHIVKYKDRVNCNEKVFCTSFFCIFWTLENGTRLVMTLLIIKMFRELYLMTLKCPVGDTKSHKLPTPKLLCEIQQTRADI